MEKVVLIMVDLEKIKNLEDPEELVEKTKIDPDKKIKKYEEEQKKLVEKSKDKTIFDEELSYPDKRFILEKVPKDSKFMKSYEDFINQVADYYAKKLPDEFVTFQIVIEEYHTELTAQNNLSEDENPTEIDLTLFQLEVKDIQRVTALVNRKKE